MSNGFPVSSTGSGSVPQTSQLSTDSTIIDINNTTVPERETLNQFCSPAYRQFGQKIAAVGFGFSAIGAVALLHDHSPLATTIITSGAGIYVIGKAIALGSQIYGCIYEPGAHAHY